MSKKRYLQVTSQVAEQLQTNFFENYDISGISQNYVKLNSIVQSSS